MSLARIVFSLSLVAALSGAAEADTAAAPGGLLRRPFWGIVAKQQPGDVVIAEVRPGATAASVGIKPGDTVLSINGKALVKPGDFDATLRSTHAGATVRVQVRRGGAVLDLRGSAVPAPPEVYPGARVTYGAVPFHDGALRSILVEPAASSQNPVVFFLQGFTCATIEARQPGGEFDELARGFSSAGIAFFRVEKPGVGDSDGSTRCGEIDMPTELDAFRAAYKRLIDSGYPPSQIIILGHSLGGIEAPALASERPPRGVIVYGTVLRNWADYMQDLDRVQDFMATDEDPAAEYRRAEADRPAIHDFFFANRSISQIVEQHPELKSNMVALFGWDGTGKAYGRSEEFVRGISRLDLPSAWQGTKSYVLSLYGASDIIALTGEDQRMIADLVNHYRPRTAEYVEVPGTMHLMDVVGDRNSYRRANKAAGQMTDGPFNPAVLQLMINWIKTTMGRPVVNSAS